MKRRIETPLLLATALLLLLIVGGCEESVDPILGEERPFTIWGFLDITADTQRVRVFTIEEQLGVDRPGTIDAVVETTDLTSGEHRVWEHQVVTYSDGTRGHLFWSAFRPETEHTYRLEVTRSDGVASTAEVTVPAPVEVQLPENISNQSKAVIRIEGPNLNLLQIRAVYEAFTLPAPNPWPPGSTQKPVVQLDVPVSYDGEQKPYDGGWLVELDMVEDYREVQDAFSINCLPIDLIGLGRVRFEFLVANDEWNPPGGEFDPETLIEPGTLSNIENGFGFFGTGFTASANWFPTDAIRRVSGYTLAASCVLQAQNIPECRVLPEPCFEGQ